MWLRLWIEVWEEVQSGMEGSVEMDVGRGRLWSFEFEIYGPVGVRVY
jgi:hypothetical protein